MKVLIALDAVLTAPACATTFRGLDGIGMGHTCTEMTPIAIADIVIAGLLGVGAAGEFEANHGGVGSGLAGSAMLFLASGIDGLVHHCPSP